jgi:hypothetical protein
MEVSYLQVFDLCAISTAKVPCVLNLVTVGMVKVLLDIIPCLFPAGLHAPNLTPPPRKGFYRNVLPEFGDIHLGQ